MQKRTVRLLFCPIKKVSIPSKVQKIGKNAFYWCSGLKYLTVKTKKLTSKTVGKGAFMKNKEDAQKLADLMIRIGELAGREVVCVLTKMDEPLGYSIGNNLEVIEAIKFLKGYMPKDLKDVVFELGANMIKLAGLGENLEENKLKIQENIVNGKGYEKFLQMVQNQGGDISYINNIDKFEKSKYIIPVTSLKSGIISDINAEDIGKVACLLGAGRIRKEAK